LKLHSEDKSSEAIDEPVFLEKLVAERRRVLKLGYVPLRQSSTEKGTSSSSKSISAATSSAPPGTQRFSTIVNEDFSQATKALYEREVARGIDEDEEIFTAEEAVTTASTPQWADKYRPRNLATSIVCRWDMNGTNTIKPITITTTHRPRSFRDTNSISSIPI